ncbi:MAG: N-formylglutamate amidohydrolase [Planctomycetota bacterium]
MILPLLLSVPHAGLQVPDWLRERCLLDDAQLVADGDVGAGQIYDLRDRVAAFVSTPVARAVLDMNRAPDDQERADGVVKTTTCWQEPVWRTPLEPADVARLLELHTDYHQRLLAAPTAVFAGVDCHTMSDVGPPIGPDPGVRRPAVCLGHVGGASCDRTWVERLRDAFAAHFGGDVTIDEPFAGGYITRTHGQRMPWVQVELSRTTSPAYPEQRERVFAALSEWCAWLTETGAAHTLLAQGTQRPKEDD